MKKYLQHVFSLWNVALIALTIGCTADMFAQVIRIERFDAPPGSRRDHFITATQSFSLLILTDSVPDCFGVTFDLRYNNAGAIVLSGYDLPNRQDAFTNKNGLLVNDLSNQTSGLGTIRITLLSGQAVIPGTGFRSPSIVRLDFNVRPEAVHGSNVVFSFINPTATTGGNGNLRLAGVSSTFAVRGFVDVWPGDADNNGIVDSQDGSLIALFYLDGGNGTGGRTRGFARNPASTVWQAQRALAWDSVRVTYVDADGSGRVDLNDALVTFVNANKVHARMNVVHPEPTPFGAKPQYPAASVLIPITVNYAQNVLGMTIKASWKHVAKDFEILGVERGELFSKFDGFLTSPINTTESWVEIAAGNYYPAQEVRAQGVVAYLVAKPLGTNTTFAPQIIESRGIARSGAVVNLSAPVSVEENASEAISSGVFPNPVSGSMLSAEFSGVASSISIIDALGQTLSHEEGMFVGKYSTDVTHLARGMYSILVKTHDRSYVFSFIRD